MIGHLRGQIRSSTPEVVILDVGGVGYELHVPISTYYEIERRSPGEEISLHVHTHVREDALALFGFWTLRERRLFERLIGVTGIGPRLAQVVLSGMAAKELLTALAASDLGRLVKIPGVGKRTAERMVVELRDKVADLAAELPATQAPSGPADEDLVEALVNLGYRRALAEKAVTTSHAELPQAEFADLLRAALRRLSKV